MVTADRSGRTGIEAGGDGDRSSCDGTFFLKVNRYKLSQCDNAQKPSWQVDSFRKYVGYATAFVEYAG